MNTTRGMIAVCGLAVALSGTQLLAAPQVGGTGQIQAAPAPLSAAARALATARANAVALDRDQFANQQSLDEFVGQEFTATVKAQAKYADGVLALYRFSDEVQPNQEAEISDPHRFERHRGLELSADFKETGRSVGQNAFGARAEVRHFRGVQDTLMFMNRPRDLYYEFRKPLPGPDAKALAERAVIIVRGRVDRSESGKVAGCNSLYLDATIDMPNTGVVQQCWVAIRVEAIELRASANGGVLAAWGPDSPAAVLDLKAAY